MVSLKVRVTVPVFCCLQVKELNSNAIVVAFVHIIF